VGKNGVQERGVLFGGTEIYQKSTATAFTFREAFSAIQENCRQP